MESTDRPEIVPSVDFPGGDADPDFRLKRWLVYFGSGQEWYSVGEFLAASETGAIERAVEVFGPGQSHRAEEIPWDAAPLPKPTNKFRIGR